MNRVKFSPLFLCEESWRGFWDWSYRWSWPKKVGVESLLSMELLNEILLCWITMLKVYIKFNWLKSSKQNSHELNKFNKTKNTLIKTLPSRTYPVVTEHFRICQHHPIPQQPKGVICGERRKQVHVKRYPGTFEGPFFCWMRVNKNKKCKLSFVQSFTAILSGRRPQLFNPNLGLNRKWPFPGNRG